MAYLELARDHVHTADSTARRAFQGFHSLGISLFHSWEEYHFEYNDHEQQTRQGPTDAALLCLTLPLTATGHDSSNAREGT